MMIDDIRIPLVLNNGEKNNQQVELDIELTEDEKKAFSNTVDEFQSIHVSYSLSGNQSCFVVYLSLNADIDYIDAHDTTRIDELEIENEIELTILPNDEENSDIVKDKDGIYDLRLSILGLLYSSIPNNYSEIENDLNSEFKVMSEEEYQKEKKASNSPFASLDSLDLE